MAADRTDQNRIAPGEQIPEADLLEQLILICPAPPSVDTTSTPRISICLSGVDGGRDSAFTPNRAATPPAGALAGVGEERLPLYARPADALLVSAVDALADPDLPRRQGRGVETQVFKYMIAGIGDVCSPDARAWLQLSR